MNIGIIGAGSIGLLFSAYLSKMNHEVTIYTRSVEQSVSINKEGVVLVCGKTTWKTPVTSKWIENGVNSHDLVIVAVKQYHLKSVSSLIGSIDKTTPLLFIQNGMGHIDLLRKFQHQKILVGVVEHGALKENLFTVIHTGIGVTKISVFNGDSLFLQKLKWGKDSLFLIQVYENWYEMLLSKLVVNSIINPLTALFRVENGDLLNNPYFFQLVQQLFKEITCLLQPSNPAIWWDSVMSVCEKTAKNRSSMLKDLEDFRETEIDGILGFYQSLPNYSHESAPILNMLYKGIKGLEGQRRR